MSVHFLIVLPLGHTGGDFPMRGTIRLLTSEGTIIIFYLIVLIPRRVYHIYPPFQFALMIRVIQQPM